jgi:Tfp pilus assembly protein PilF
LALGAVAALLSGCGSAGGAHSATGAASPGAAFTALIGAGTQLLAQGDPAAALQVFRHAVREEPRSPVGYFDVGVVDEDLGDTSAALRQYRRALFVDRAYAPALYNEAVIYAPSAPQVAEADYRAAIAAQPDSPTALLNLGLLEAEGRQAGALADLERAVALDPGLRSRIPARLRARLPASGATSAP